MLPGVKPSRELLMSDVDVRSTASPLLRSLPPSPEENTMLKFHLRRDLDLLRAELNFCRERSERRGGWTDHGGHN